MKLISPKRIKLIDSWKMDYMRVDSVYSGVLEGGISDGTNDFILKGSKYYFKKLEGRNEEDVNVIPRYMGKISQVLKPLQLHTLLNDMDNLVFLVTFLDETEEVEDVINEILSMPELIKKEFMF